MDVPVLVMVIVYLTEPKPLVTVERFFEEMLVIFAAQAMLFPATIVVSVTRLEHVNVVVDGKGTNVIVWHLTRVIVMESV